MRLFVVVLFAACFVGACSGAWSLTIKGDQARVKAVGAPGGTGAWNLWANGEWGDYIRISKAGEYRVRVRCWGSVADGVWPWLGLTVDGELAESAVISYDKEREQSFTFKAKPGNYRVAVYFSNDHKTETEDRNVYIASMAIEPPAGAPAPVLADPDTWQATNLTRQAKAEQDALAKARRDIERNRKTGATIRVIDAHGKPVAGAKVEVVQTTQDFLFGCNIFQFDNFKDKAKDELYKQRFRDIFNYATLPFYWCSFEMEQGKPNYPYIDSIVDWCGANGITMKGHPLLWSFWAGVPPWSKTMPPVEVQKQRVTDIVKRYSGKIHYWEVVNEPSHCYGITVDEPYRWAREADPKGELIINDYNVFADGCPQFLDLLQKAKQTGVPFDGIGIQAHEPSTMRFPLDRIQRIMDQYAGLGKKLHITEFTPTSAGTPITGSHLTGKWDEAAQADYAAKFYTVCFAHPAVAGITWWDLCEEGAWLPGGGILHKDLSPKPAYTALRSLIRDRWMTRTQGKTSKDGSFKFRGFQGDYTVKVTVGGKQVTQNLGVHLNHSNAITCRMQ